MSPFSWDSGRYVYKRSSNKKASPAARVSMIPVFAFRCFCVSALWCMAHLPVFAQSVFDLDSTIAKTAEPYVVMACSAYGSCKAGDLAATGFKADLDWKTAMRRAGVGDNIISLYERSGFSATIYRNDSRKEIAIAYRGSEGGVGGALSALKSSTVAKFTEKYGFGSRDLFEGDWRTDLRAKELKSPTERLIAQYVAARSLAARIDKVYSGSPYRDYKVSLTGHSLGGALASYAGQNVKAANVYAIEPARNALSGTGSNPNQINIILRGDPVSNPRAPGGKLTGTVDYLPGRTYITSAPRSLNPLNAHDPGVVVSRIRDVAASSSPTISGGRLPASATSSPSVFPTTSTPAVITRVPASTVPIYGSSGSLTPLGSAPPVVTSSPPARGVNVDVTPSGQTKDLSDVRKDVLRLRGPGM